MKQSRITKTETCTLSSLAKERSPLTGFSLKKAENLALRDGKLQTREGTVRSETFSGAVRGYGSFGNDTYAVAGTTLYRKDGDTWEAMGTVSGTGECTFFSYEGEIFLSDGTEWYGVGETAIATAKGYVPLYGRNWSPTLLGDQNEPINLLTDCLSVSYANVTGNTAFLLPFYPETIDKILLDGTETAQYSLSGLTLTVPGAGSHTEVVVTFTKSTLLPDRRKITYCPVIFSDLTASALFVGGSTEYLYRNRTVSETDRISASVRAPESGILYFTYDERQRVGRADNPVLNMERWYHGMLFFTSTDTYYMDEDGDTVPVANVGAIGRKATAKLGDTLYLLSNTGIWQITAQRSAEEELKFTPYTGKHKFDSVVRLAKHPRKNEIWCYSPLVDGIDIISPETDLPIRYTGIAPTNLFFETEPMTAVGANLLAFSDDAETDWDGSEIEWLWETEYARQVSLFNHPRDYLLSLSGSFPDDAEVKVFGDTFTDTFEGDEWTLDDLPAQERRDYTEVSIRMTGEGETEWNGFVFTAVN